MAKDDNPFGAEPPSTDPFGRPISSSDDAFTSPAPAEQTSVPPPGDHWETAPAPPPSDEFARPPEPAQKAQGAVPSLVLGLIGVILCGLCAPFAWAIGRKAEREIDASGGTLGGRGLATAGKILGIIGTGLLVIGIIALIALIAFGSSVDSGGGTTTTFEF